MARHLNLDLPQPRLQFLTTNPECLWDTLRGLLPGPHTACVFPVTAVTNYRKLSGLNHTTFLPGSSGGQRSDTVSGPCSWWGRVQFLLSYLPEVSAPLSSQPPSSRLQIQQQRLWHCPKHTLQPMCLHMLQNRVSVPG